MTLETTVNDLTLAVTTLTTSVQDKRTVLDNAAQQAAASLTTTQGLQAQAATSAATAAAKATEATNNATQIAAYKTAAAALDTSTTATAAVTNLLPDMLAKKDPARHPFRKKMPTLVLDFERQKCHRYAPGSGFGETALSSFMTFARNSTATYTGPDGLLKTAAANEPRYDYDPMTGECKGLLVEEQRTNLKTYSTFPLKSFGEVKAVLTKSNIVSPDGTLTNGVFERRSTGNGSYAVLNSAVTIGTQTSFVFSLYVKKRDARYMSLRIQEPTVYSSLSNAVFDLDTGTVTLQATNVGEYTEADCGITAAGAGWFRVWIKAKTGALPTAYGLFSCSDIPTAVIDGLATVANLGVYFYGPQLEVGAFPTSYIQTPATFTGRASTATYLDANGVVQTAASGVARSNAYDYDSDGVLRPIGLLLEASATNQLLYSEQFDNAAWGKTGSSVTANAVVAPDGLTTADAFLDDATNVYHRVSQSLSVTAGSTYTYSTYVKAGAVQYLVLNGAALIGAAATFDLTAGTVSLVISGSASLQKLANGWFRCSVTGVAPTTQTSQCFIGFNTSNVDGAYIGSGQVCGYLWGAQLGVGSYPTSYIATTSAQVTRAADTSTSAQATRAADGAKVVGVNFSDWHNIDGFTAFATYEWGVDVNQQAFGRGVFGFSDTNNSNSWCYVYNGSAYSALVANTNSGQQFYKTSGSPNEPANVMHSIAFRYKKNNAAVSFNGGSVASDTNCELPVFNNLNIGSISLTSIYRLGGHVKRIVVYPTAFTNEELQAVTSA